MCSLLAAHRLSLVTVSRGDTLIAGASASRGGGFSVQSRGSGTHGLQ